MTAKPVEAVSDGTLVLAPPFNAWDHIDIALLRERNGWNPSPAKGYRVQLGAGRKYIKGFDNLDYPEWDAHDMSMSKRWRLPYDDGTVAEVVSYFTLDHLYPWAVVGALREIQRVLKVGGTFACVVPHYSSQLANECIMHKSRFGVDTWRNIFSERQYDHLSDGGTGEPWRLKVNVNFMYGITERNLVLVTQMVKAKA